MIEAILVAGGVAVATLLVDQQNLVPQISNNPRQLWLWDPARYAPAPAARATIPIQRPRLSPEQAWKEQVALEQKLEWQTAQKSSKYIVTDHSSPSTDFVPYRK